LAEELEALEMSAAELARNTDVPINRITQILNGTRRSQAIQICAWDFFGTSAEFWLNLQSLYDLRLAREEAGKAIKALPSLRRQDQCRSRRRHIARTAFWE
jgi:addiction module HigA family antidote